MPKLIWEKKLQKPLKCKLRFYGSISYMSGNIFVQRYCKNINKKLTEKFPIIYALNQDLNLLNFMQKLNVLVFLN